MAGAIYDGQERAPDTQGRKAIQSPVQEDSEMAEQKGKVMTTQDDKLPKVTGKMVMSHQDFQRACRVKIQEEQEKGELCDLSMLLVLCEAVRCSEECCELAKARMQI